MFFIYDKENPERTEMIYFHTFKEARNYADLRIKKYLNAGNYYEGDVQIGFIIQPMHNIDKRKDFKITERFDKQDRYWGDANDLITNTSWIFDCYNTFLNIEKI